MPFQIPKGETHELPRLWQTWFGFIARHSAWDVGAYLYTSQPILHSFDQLLVTVHVFKDTCIKTSSRAPSINACRLFNGVFDAARLRNVCLAVFPSGFQMDAEQALPVVDSVSDYEKIKRIGEGMAHYMLHAVNASSLGLSI